jgi:hypothetical protein
MLRACSDWITALLLLWSVSTLLIVMLPLPTIAALLGGYVCDVQHRQRTVCNQLRRIVGEGTDVGQSEIASAV